MKNPVVAGCKINICMTNIIESLLILLIVFTPLAFGTVDNWAISLFLFIVAVTALLFVWKDHSCYNYTSSAEYPERQQLQNQKFSSTCHEPVFTRSFLKRTVHSALESNKLSKPLVKMISRSESINKYLSCNLR